MLENGFNINSGTLSQGGREFGRQAYVGLSSPILGTITAGRQIGIINQTLALYESGIQFATYGAHIGDNDNIFPTFRVNNVVQYSAAVYRGFKLQRAYAFSNSSGEFSNNSAAGLGVN